MPLTISSPVVKNRFWDKVNKNGPIHPVHGVCWNWTACVGGSGNYGHMTIFGKGWFSHRYSYTIHFGFIPDGLSVLHKCDNVLCVNPSHLFLGTALDNARDRNRKGRQSKGEGRWAHKLTEGQVKEIRQRYRSWASNKSNSKQLAEEFGVTRDHIRVVAIGKSWKHLNFQLS